ncbi:hypothetical protein PAHAL_5G059300 [Panicum hallii]|uniref:Uncharacterized protein n=1 Tax=Panicum hallii TaxID=206008 RepID=A0A2T8IJ46_9POAL|nr:hypothetical protein PAHAL_5G059300 [Panicum hallii]
MPEELADGMAPTAPPPRMAWLRTPRRCDLDGGLLPSDSKIDGRRGAPPEGPRTHAHGSILACTSTHTHAPAAHRSATMPPHLQVWPRHGHKMRSTSTRPPTPVAPRLHPPSHRYRSPPQVSSSSSPPSNRHPPTPLPSRPFLNRIIAETPAVNPGHLLKFPNINLSS